ncbi:hypothetical protein V8F66_15430 [Vreelandella sp. SM1641]|jgi:hypothetical protein|uniref:Uncharacterized protein n=2 Tax=Vreelandella TaxID=3137766 RepID=A0AAP9NNB9_9GAMM|nr:hypothetical protein FX987_02526 [Halomonas titanicae]|tara:strand:- start:734 stop:886 length:153 start_codon:yes stop_codon:yes gene_type:complete
MTTQAFSHPVTEASVPLLKRIGLSAYRLLERMTERSYRQHKTFLTQSYGL